MLRVNQQKVIRFIADNPELKEAFRHFLETNSGQSNPYHNTNHTLAMMDILIGMWGSGIRPEVTLTDLLTAAVFHDYGHTGGMATDDINVGRACAAVKAFYQDDPEKVTRLTGLIEATQYPYVIPWHSLTVAQRMLREADFLVAFYEDFFTQVLLGLREEFSRISEVHFRDLIDSEKKFLEDSWDTPELQYSRDIINEYGQDLLKYLDLIKRAII